MGRSCERPLTLGGGASDVPLFQMTASKEGKTWLIDDRMSLQHVRQVRPVLRHADYEVKVELIF